MSLLKIRPTKGETEKHQCQKYITNWHRRTDQSISHCLWLRRHARFVWTRTQMMVPCSPQPAALSVWFGPPYCFNWASKARKWHVTSTSACFLHTLPPHKTFSSFSSTGTWGETHRKDSREVEAAAVLWQFPVESLIFPSFFFKKNCN